MKQSISKITAIFATGTAFFGSCCVLPLLLMGLGIGSAGLTTALAPFRPYLIGGTILLLGIAFYTVYGRKQNCECEGACDIKSIRRTKILLWVATGFSLLFLIGPELIARCFL